MSRLKIVYRQGHRETFVWIDRCFYCPRASETGALCTHPLLEHNGFPWQNVPDDGGVPDWCPAMRGPMTETMESE